MKHSILCVDDEVDNVDALERLFRRKYRVLKATSGDDALEILRDEHNVALIISDQRMPNMSGVEFLKESMSSHPDSIRILLTGFTDIESVIGAINSGEVYRYINKPWDPVDLQNTVDKAIEKYDLTLELREKNKALREALDELKTLDEAKNHFMVLINHELKTPLTVIKSFLELILETKITKEQQKYLDRISQSSDRLQKLVNDVLELVSAETGITKVSKKKTSTEKVLADITKTFQDDAQSKDLNFEFNVEDLPVKADQKIIRTVLSKVIDNAVKFGDKKSNIVIESTKLDNGNALISVTNKGKSLSKEAINNILKPFALDENIMNHSQGTGLGLSLCQALLKQHSSQLKLECPKGQVKVSFELSQ